MPAVLTASPTPRSRRTVAECISRVLRDVGMGNHNLNSAADVLDWLNDGQDELAERSGWFRGTYLGSTVANQAEYDLPAAPSARFLTIEEVYLSGDRVAYLPFEQLQALWGTFRDQTSTAPRWWSARGGSSIYLHPAPSAAGTDVLRIWGIALPPYVSQDGDKLYVPHGLERAILDYACLQASIKDAHGEGARRIQYYAGKWERWIEHAIRRGNSVSLDDVTALGEDAVGRAAVGPGYIDPNAVVTAPV